MTFRQMIGRNEGIYTDIWVRSIFRRWTARTRAIMQEHGSHTQELASQWMRLAAVSRRRDTGERAEMC